MSIEESSAAVLNLENESERRVSGTRTAEQIRATLEQTDQMRVAEKSGKTSLTVKRKDTIPRKGNQQSNRHRHGLLRQRRKEISRIYAHPLSTYVS